MSCESSGVSMFDVFQSSNGFRKYVAVAGQTQSGCDNQRCCVEEVDGRTTGGCGGFDFE